MKLAALVFGLAMPSSDVDGAALAEPPRAAVVAEAPKPAAANIVFAEALGSGLLYSVNYERLVGMGRFGLRAGASFFTYGVSRYGSSGNLTIVSFPLVASHYFVWASHRLQLGAGGTVLHTDVATDSRGVGYGGERAGTTFAPTAVVGYRYVPRGGGFSFGVAFTPLLRASKLLPWAGVTAGYAF